MYGIFTPCLLYLDVAGLIAGGFLPGGIPPELLGYQMNPKSSKSNDDKVSSSDNNLSSSRSSTPHSPSTRHHKSKSSSHSSHNMEKTVPTESNQLTGDERIPVISLTTGKQVLSFNIPVIPKLGDLSQT